MFPVELLIGVLATWRIAAFLVYEHWTEGLRQRAGVYILGDDDLPQDIAGRVLACFWCVTMLVSLPVTLVLLYRWWWALLPFALSGGAIILNHWTRIVRDVER